MEKLFQVESKRIKTIFIDESTFYLAEKRVLDKSKFIKMYEYSEMYDIVLKFTFTEIKQIKVENQKVNFKGNQKSDGFDISIKDITFDSEMNLKDFLSIIDKIQILNKKQVTENKFKSAYKSPGVIILIFGLTLSYLSSQNDLDFDSSSGKRKIAGKLLSLIFESLGPTLSLIIGIFISLLGAYSLWQKFQRPTELLIYDKKN
ncbi:hypothetical protein [Cellulophaga baltica]|uniref:hypothetical protein n=1 Tax=Cellulophaga baltica TaxID=76594 RepID=UPI002495949A|nr:hypothetical protein [Cellulophaga baltica]